MTDNWSTISEAIQEGDREKVVGLVNKALADKKAPLDILNKGMIPGIEALGEKFRSGEFFLPEILISARAMGAGIEVLKKHLPQEAFGRRGTVVIGTVEGDLHDIGKNLVKIMLECSGFKVQDLGVDVPVTKFVDAAREHGADIIAISALLTTTMVNMPRVTAALGLAGLKHKVKVMIGGAPVTRRYADEIGAEGFAEDCTAAVQEAKRLVGK